MTSVSQTIDYTKKQYMHSSYRWMKLTPVGGSGQSATLSTTSSTIVNFEIPNNVINLAQSKLVFDMVIPVAGVGSAVCVDALGFSLFDRITLSTRSGVVLANCDNMGQFTHLISKLKTKLSDLSDNSSAGGFIPFPNKTGATVITNLATYPNLTHANATEAVGKLRPFTDICRSNALPSSLAVRGLVVAGTAQAQVVPIYSNNNIRLDGSYITTPLYEPLSFITSNLNTTATIALANSYQLPLGSIKDTLLEINKSLYFGDNLILSLSFNPATKFSWVVTRTADPSVSTTSTNLITAAVVIPAAPATAFSEFSPTNAAVATTLQPALSNLALYVSVETDPIITSQLINKVNTEGFSMTVPYVYCTKTPISVSALTAGGADAFKTSSFAMQQRITRGYGQRLLRCYSAIFGNETIAAGNQAAGTGTLPKTVSGDIACLQTQTVGFTINQHNDTALSAYNTSLDGIRLQDFTLSGEDATHYLVNEPYLRGSCILNVEQYKNQCMHIDSWTGNPICQEDDTVDNGISLDADKTYGVTYTTLNNITSSSSFQHYLFFVVQRSLMIKGNQIMLV